MIDIKADSLLDRREILKMGLCGFVATATPFLLSTEAKASSSTWRTSFRNAHTGESFNGVYRVGNKYLPDAFERISYVLRDFRTGEVFPMDPRVVDIMTVIHKKTGMSTPVNILSGYRSPKTNANLRGATSGVAKNSFHMYGQALDIRVPGYKTSGIRKIAMGLKAGGVGYYPKSGFVHVDTGNVRSWSM
ncbi:MAG: twin-arginine translocation pathway signal sequence domain-containing protein [Micavibrio sp.]|nr:twin-arginine translocation pathway signal sequence domain-containing protein [Micavibrio sp.]|tara:strand:+ start:2890 stop:3459 length:570 start_codon:yes stop_codon:yes gene_type:complete